MRVMGKTTERIRNMGKLLPTFAERFREVIGGRTLTSIAEQLQLTRTTISLYCNNQRIPDAETLKRICELFQCSADWLLGLSDAFAYRDTTPAGMLQNRTVNALLSHEKFSEIVWYIRKAAENKPDYYNDNPDGELLALIKEVEEKGLSVMDNSEARELYIERAKTVLGDIIRGIIR